MGVRFESLTEAYRVKKMKRGMNHGQKNISSPAVWHPDVWGLTTLLVEGTVSLWTGIYTLSGLGLTGSSKPWKAHVVQGSRLDVVSSGVQTGHTGQRKNTLPPRQNTHQGQQELEHDFHVSDVPGWICMCPLVTAAPISCKSEGSLLYCACFVLLTNKLFSIRLYFSCVKSRNWSC